MLKFFLSFFLSFFLLVMLVLYGSVFPLLSLALCLSSCCYATYLQVELGRLLDISTQEELFIIDFDCRDASKKFRNCISPIVIFIPLFYAFFFFDMIGDEKGIIAGSIMLLSVLCLVSTGVITLWLRYYILTNREIIRRTSVGIDMQTIRVSNPIVTEATTTRI